MSASSIGAAAGYAANMTIAPITAAVGFIAGLGQENLDEAKRVKQAQLKLEEQRRKELADQAAAREAAKLKAANTGQTIGRPNSYSSFSSALGFGSGNTQQGLSVGSLFGN